MNEKSNLIKRAERVEFFAQILLSVAFLTILVMSVIECFGEKSVYVSIDTRLAEIGNQKFEWSAKIEPKVENEIKYPDGIEYLAQCVEAEAGNQGYMGKVYVCDCILNRFDAGEYENFYEVINEEGQFVCVSNGSIDCIPTDETYEVVWGELKSRTNTEILHFRTDYYHSFGTPCFNYRDHYFSK